MVHRRSATFRGDASTAAGPGVAVGITTHHSDSIEQLERMPGCGDAKLLQVLVPQARENRLVFVILAEDRLVLAEAQAPQPDHDVHDGAHNREWRTSSAGEARVSRADWIMGVSEVHKDRCGHIANGRVYR
jgi:hypothetical protein